MLRSSPHCFPSANQSWPAGLRNQELVWVNSWQQNKGVWAQNECSLPLRVWSHLNSQRFSPPCGPATVTPMSLLKKIFSAFLRMELPTPSWAVHLISLFPKDLPPEHLRSSLPVSLLSFKTGSRKAMPISKLFQCLRPQSYFYISFPHIMAIYILQQSTWVSKTHTRNNNASPGASQKP